METKKCPSCNESRTLDCFSKNSSTKSGLSCYCKICESLKKKEQRKSKSSKVYKIFSVKGNLCYIGSTIQNLNRRFQAHKYDHLHGNSITSGKILLFEDAEIVELETHPTTISKEELRIREQYWIDNTPDCVNKFPAFLTEEEAINRIKIRDKERSKNPD